MASVDYQKMWEQEQAVADRRLWDDEEFADLTIRCGTRRYLVHTAILGTRSTFLKHYDRHIKTSPLEGKYCAVDPEEYSVLGDVLEWIYTGRCSLTSPSITCSDEIQVDAITFSNINGTASMDATAARTVEAEQPILDSNKRCQERGGRRSASPVHRTIRKCDSSVRSPDDFLPYIYAFYAAVKFGVPSLRAHLVTTLRTRLGQNPRFGFGRPIHFRYAIQRAWRALTPSWGERELRNMLLAAMANWCCLLFSAQVSGEVKAEVAAVVWWALGPGSGRFGREFLALLVKGEVLREGEEKEKVVMAEEDADGTGGWIMGNQAVDEAVRMGVDVNEAVIRSNLSVEQARARGWPAIQGRWSCA
ncbi:MAG: hypothetical protein M1822_007552 [Bathelium mastoideum]|nr:MAG: hypothetical protein M1822_007552 [Bathelium mastoideum]